jgi:hypothetical protein
VSEWFCPVSSGDWTRLWFVAAGRRPDQCPVLSEYFMTQFEDLPAGHILCLPVDSLGISEYHQLLLCYQFETMYL